MSGDEFVILCEDLVGSDQVEGIADRVCATVAVPFPLSGIEVEMTASVGIAFAGRGDQLSAQLLQEADAAMYMAKGRGGGQHQVIDLRELRPVNHQTGLDRDLVGALDRGELRTEYQPIVSTTNGQVIGVEALLRWDHPSRGLVSPLLLIPLAERSGLITEIGRWVLERACRDQRRWAGEELMMSVNVSAQQLMSPDFATTVSDVLSATGADPERVILEVTESVLMQDTERALVVLNDLKRVGVSIALDDFGTGYSSLNHLKRFPIDVVKIDQGFVAELDRDEASLAIVHALVELTKMLGMTVVAEGVETAEQYQQLTMLACNSCQGYYFARPMSADNLTTLLGEHRAGGPVRLPAAAIA